MNRSDLPRCARCEENQARYIDEIGLLVCGTCPVAEGFDSIKIADVPQLLQWARDVLAGGFMGGYSFGKLREIIGRHPAELQRHEADVSTHKNKWPCPGKPEDLKGMPIGMYHCEFCGEMQLAGSTHLAPQFPSQWEEPFPKVEEPPDYGPDDGPYDGPDEPDMISYPTAQVRMESIVEVGPPHTRPALVPPSSFPTSMMCPSCGAADSVTFTREAEHFPYGVEPHTVDLAAVVDKGRCSACAFEFTDGRAEVARDEAVKIHLSSLKG